MKRFGLNSKIEYNNKKKNYIFEDEFEIIQNSHIQKSDKISKNKIPENELNIFSDFILINKEEKDLYQEEKINLKEKISLGIENIGQNFFGFGKNLKNLLGIKDKELERKKKEIERERSEKELEALEDLIQRNDRFINRKINKLQLKILEEGDVKSEIGLRNIFKIASIKEKYVERRSEIRQFSRYDEKEEYSDEEYFSKLNYIN